MALTVQNLSRGNYVLGGPGRLQGPSAAEAMDLAQREEQRFRDAQRQARQTELAMQETRQAMALRQSQEQRAQANFRAQQAARSQAANQDALRRRLLEQYGGAAVGEAPGLVTGAPGVGVRTPAAGVTTGRAGLSLNVSGTGVSGLGLTVPAPTQPAPTMTLPQSPSASAAQPEYVQVASLDPMEAFRYLGAQTGTPGRAGVQLADASGTLPAGAQPAGQPVRTTYYGVDFDIYPDGRIVNLSTGVEIPDSPEFADLRTAVQAMASGDPLRMMAPSGVRPLTGQELPAGVDAPGIYTNLRGDFPGVARADEYLAEGVINELEYQQLTRGTRTQQREIFRAVVDRRRSGESAPPVPTEPAPTVEVQTTAPNGEQTTVTVDEGPTVSPDAGLRDPASASPIDQILRQPVGSGAVASDIPRDLPRLSAAITQGFTERERLVEAYNAFSRAGLTEDAQGYLQAIQNLDQTLIRLQGEQAINDLRVGSPERASQLLSYYYGVDIAPDALLGANIDELERELRRAFDDEYRAAMAEGRERYLITRAEQQAEREAAAEDEQRRLEEQGFRVVGRETDDVVGGGWRVENEATGESYFAYTVLDENEEPVFRFLEIPTTRYGVGQ